MIPYKLKIHGIRDYSPRIIHFGEPHEHILITGPNGVGKSTLTFCLGAVLYSSKVEIEGLRSTNLKDHEPWVAGITFIFLNEGPTKIDGPKYIAFQLKIKQDMKNGPIQREYEVLNGDEEEALQSHARYTSGGTDGFNFSAYREALQIRYKIEPDLYYLIWYQQEVNQFAAMYPEERFRKFSDMFNISNIQKEWEASLEQIKEVEADIERFKSIQKTSEMLLNIAKTELQQYLDNQKRLVQYGKKYFTLLHNILDVYKELIEQKSEEKTKHAIEKEKLLVDKTTLQQTIKQMQQKYEEQQTEIETLKQQQHDIEQQLAASRLKHTNITREKNKLAKELEAIADKRKRLQYDEQTTRAKLIETTDQLQRVQAELAVIDEQRGILTEQEKLLRQQQVEQEYAINQLQQELKQAKEATAIYRSSANVQQQIDECQHEIAADFETIQQLQQQQRKLKEQIQQYKQNKVESKRQQEGLQHLKQQQLEAYTLREFIELMPTAPVDWEQRLESIKYTIFYVGKHYKPVNDLYYVSLTELIPTESISKITELGLQIRSDLSDQQANYANKALWWVKQFFIGQPKIEQNGLVDARGVRGAQEAMQYILSDAAIERLLTQAITQYNEVEAKLQQVKLRYDQLTKKVQQLNSHLMTIKYAESALLKEPALATHKTQLESTLQGLDAVWDQAAAFDIKHNELLTQESELKYKKQMLSEQCTIYDELGAFAEQQIELDRLEQACAELQTEVIHLQHHRDELQSAISDKGFANNQLYNELDQHNGTVNALDRKMTELELKITNAQEQLDTYDTMKSRYEIDLSELFILPAEAQQLDEQHEKLTSLSMLQSEIAQTKANLNSARQEEVKENAQQNYDMQKKEFDKKAADLANAEQLLESNTIRANELEDRLETTINMFLTKINALFQKYMDVFQFEGQIEKERVEEKNGRIRFLLYIKARKHGHKGTLEDVSMKARSGKVGKGVSGGEESLSSLLFALALLQNLSISPGYIVLDEFDSALDDERKNKVFNLYANELKRKLIIVSPKGHDDTYYNCFSKVYIVEHDASIPKSTIRGIQNRNS